MNYILFCAIALLVACALTLLMATQFPSWYDNDDSDDEE